MTGDLLTIGAFSRRTGVSPRALRIYDESGLLRPAEVDPRTGYRRYGPAQLPVARAIRLLRDLEMPLDDIAALLGDPSPARIRAALVAHRARIAARHAELHVVLTRLGPLIDGREPLMGDQRADAIDPAARRRLAVDLFNHTWTLIETAGRTPQQDDEMLHAAHASRFHWGEVGTPLNLARGEWQCSRVYAVLGRAEPALHHARRCLEILDTADGAEEFDVPYAHEALARAHALAGDTEEARAHLETARGMCASIADADDRDLLEADLATIDVAW